MTQNECIRAFMAANNLNAQTFSNGRTAKKIFDLVKLLRPVWEFQTQEELKICESHPNIDPANMTIEIKDGITTEDAVKELDDMQAKLRELGGMETEIKAERFTIDLSKEQVRISGKEIEDLEPFILFTDGDEAQ